MAKHPFKINGSFTEEMVLVSTVGNFVGPASITADGAIHGLQSNKLEFKGRGSFSVTCYVDSDAPEFVGDVTLEPLFPGKAPAQCTIATDWQNHIFTLESCHVVLKW